MIWEFLRARNPLCLPASSLPGTLLLMARLVIMVLLVRGYATVSMPGRGVPFLAIFESFGTDYGWKRALTAMCLSGAALVFLNLLPRLGCLLVGASLVLGTSIDLAGYSNSRLFSGCLLLLTALQDGTTPARFALRAQIFLLYLGATLSKVFEPDWWSGQYFEFWLREKLGILWYAHLADSLPPMSLSIFMGVTTIVMEFAICTCLLSRHLWPGAFAVAIVFHVAAFLVCGLDFGVFLYVSILSFLVFAPDDLIHRVATLPIHSAASRLIASPAVWMLIMLMLPLSGQLWPMGQKIAVASVALMVLWIAWVFLRAARGRAVSRVRPCFRVCRNVRRQIG